MSSAWNTLTDRARELGDRVGYDPEGGTQERYMEDVERAQGDEGFDPDAGEIARWGVRKTTFPGRMAVNEVIPEFTDYESGEEVSRDIQEASIGARETAIEEPREAAPGPRSEGAVRGIQTAADIFVTFPARAGVKTVTGVDPLGSESEVGLETFNQSAEEVTGDPTGETGETPTAWEAAELATFGIGAGVGSRAARSGARYLPEAVSSNMAVRGLRSLLRSGDEAVDAARSGDEAVDAVRGGDEIASGASPVDDVPYASMSFDDFARSADNIVPTSRTATRGTTTADELRFGSVDSQLDELDDVIPQGTDLGARTLDEFDDVASSVRTNIGDTLPASFRSGSSTADEAAQTFRSGPRTSGAARTATEAAEEGAEEAPGILTRIREANPFGRLSAGAILGSAVVGGVAFTPTEDGDYLYEPASTWRRNGNVGQAIRVSREGNELGYAVLINPEETGRPTVLTVDASTRSANITMSQLINGTPDTSGSSTAAGSGSNLRPEFDTEQQARSAFVTWADRNEGGGGTSTSGTSREWDGSLDAPSSVQRGESFEARATVRNTGNSEMEAEFVLAIVADGDAGRLDSVRRTVESGAADEMTFRVAGQMQDIPAGEYRLALLAMGDGEGTVARSPFEVTGGSGGDGGQAQDEWETPERVRELSYGWVLFVQRHAAEDRQRFLIAGQREDGTTIFIEEGGETAESPAYFETQDEAIAAYQAWAERMQSGEAGAGEAPDPAGPTPTPEELHEQTASSGLGAALSDPVTVGIGLVVVAVVLEYTEFGPEPISMAQEYINEFTQEYL